MRIPWENYGKKCTQNAGKPTYDQKRGITLFYAGICVLFHYRGKVQNIKKMPRAGITMPNAIPLCDNGFPHIKISKKWLMGKLWEKELGTRGQEPSDQRPGEPCPRRENHAFLMYAEWTKPKMLPAIRM